MPNWTYNPFKSMERNWQSFAVTTGIAVTRRSSQPERDHHERERRAFIMRWVNTGFNEHYGADANNLEAWKSICETIGIEGARDFSSISQCKKVQHVALRSLKVEWRFHGHRELTNCSGAEEILC